MFININRFFYMSLQIFLTSGIKKTHCLFSRKLIPVRSFESFGRVSSINLQVYGFISLKNYILTTFIIYIK